MNKVNERCQKQSCAKFLYASQKMFNELKHIKIFMYLLNVVPVVICFLPSSNEITKLACSCVSFAMTLINEVVSALLSNYKETAILEHQLYEAEVTGSSFSKIEYDREMTNDLNELAIRKGVPKLNKKGKYPESYVPQEISDDYSYLYLCRISAAKTRYLVTRLFYLAVVCLIIIAVLFISVNFAQRTTAQTLYTLVCFWPLIVPIIKNATACRKCNRQCVKICADIDNFFADGDESVERLARFYYYAQNIEFEMMLTRPTIYKFLQFLCRRNIKVLTDGVTIRFEEAIVELKGRNLMLKGVLSKPKGKNLITKVDYDMDYILSAKRAMRKEKKERALLEKNISAKQKTNKSKTVVQTNLVSERTSSSTKLDVAPTKSVVVSATSMKSSSNASKNSLSPAKSSTMLNKAPAKTINSGKNTKVKETKKTTKTNSVNKASNTKMSTAKTKTVKNTKNNQLKKKISDNKNSSKKKKQSA